MTRLTATVALLAALWSAAPTSAQRFADRNKKPETAEATDWPAEVQRACVSSRYGLQLAASRKVADAGDAAVPAIQDWVGAHGQNALPAIFVNAIADAEPAGQGLSRCCAARPTTATSTGGPRPCAASPNGGKKTTERASNAASRTSPTSTGPSRPRGCCSSSRSPSAARPRGQSCSCGRSDSGDRAWG